MSSRETYEARDRMGLSAYGDPKTLRCEAVAMDRLADVLSYGPDKERLRAKAAEYRERADALDCR